TKSDMFSDVFLKDINSFGSIHQYGIKFGNTSKFSENFHKDMTGFKHPTIDNIALYMIVKPNPQGKGSLHTEVPKDIKDGLTSENWIYKYPYIIKNKNGEPRRIATHDRETQMYYKYDPDNPDKKEPLFF